MLCMESFNKKIKKIFSLSILSRYLPESDNEDTFEGRTDESSSPDITRLHSGVVSLLLVSTIKHNVINIIF